MEKHKRPSDVNQQIAKSVRPQLPRDGSAGGKPTHRSGELPKGGYQSIWSFRGNDTKDSSTSKPGNAGGGRIC